jgi:nucleotide-binding universal stress UspA family protein
VKRILAPIDMSEHSLHALALAALLGAKLEARVTALHVFDASHHFGYAMPNGLDVGAFWPLDEVRKETRRHFEEALNAFDWRGAEHGRHFLEGSVADTIAIQSRAYDLVVMGTHGRTGLAAAVLGNVAWSVLAESDKPVLAVRQPSRRFPELGRAGVEEREVASAAS